MREFSTVDESQMRTRGEVVKNPENFADVIYGRSLREGTTQTRFTICKYRERFAVVAFCRDGVSQIPFFISPSLTRREKLMPFHTLRGMKISRRRVPSVSFSFVEVVQYLVQYLNSVFEWPRIHFGGTRLLLQNVPHCLLLPRRRNIQQ